MAGVHPQMESPLLSLASNTITFAEEIQHLKDAQMHTRIK